MPNFLVRVKIIEIRCQLSSLGLAAESKDDALRLAKQAIDNIIKSRHSSLTDEFYETYWIESVTSEEPLSRPTQVIDSLAERDG